MQASTAMGAAAGTATGDKPASPAKATTQAPSRRLIDAPTRAFHWLFALCFVGAYLSADGERWRLLHVVLGYSMAGLLTFRVLYGLVGPKQVRLTALGAKLAGGRAWLHSLWRARSPAEVNWRQGQNLFMALAVLALLVLVVPITLTGYASFNEWGGDWLGEVHEAVGEAFLWVVVGHLAAIAGPELVAAQKRGRTHVHRAHRRPWPRCGQTQPRLAGLAAVRSGAGLRGVGMAAGPQRARQPEQPARGLWRA
jgi:cytochrome b